MRTDRARHFEEVWRARSHGAGSEAGLDGNVRAQKALRLLSAGQRFLDVGCGAGILAEAAMPRFAEVYGVDISGSAVEEARRRGVRAEICEVGAEPFPFDSASFDVVSSMSVPQFIADINGLLNECRRVLRPGGQLVVSVPNMRAAWRIWKLVVRGEFPRTSIDPVGVDGGTLHYFTRRSICGLLEGAAFDVVACDGIYCRPRWIEDRWENAPFSVLKREFLSGEVLVNARSRT